MKEKESNGNIKRKYKQDFLTPKNESSKNQGILYNPINYKFVFEIILGLNITGKVQPISYNLKKIL